MELPSDLEAMTFRCNVCGTDNTVAIAQCHRELAACTACTANARFRGVIWGLANALGGGRAQRPLVDWPVDKKVRGIGMSDAPAYAEPLARVCDYTNTFYDAEPRLDITAPRLPWKDLDFIISTDVFEHVAPPLGRAFDGLAALLRPGGALIFSVPYTYADETLEHFPELHTWQLGEFQGKRVLINRDRGGRYTVHDDLVFHGGSGATLELRVFSRNHLTRELRASGFHDIFEYAQPELSVGYYWPLMNERAGQPPTAGYVLSARR